MADDNTQKKQKRRGHGEGSIFQRNDGRWVAKIQIGVDENGNPKIKSFYDKQRKGVVAKLNNYKLTHAQGFDSLSNVTLRDYITSWLTTVKINDLKPLSYDRLESTINNYIIDNIGHYKINDLTGAIIQDELINAMYNQNLSHSSIKKAYNAINACLKFATNNRQILYNPVNTVVMPSSDKFEKEEITILADGDRKAFETACIIKYKNGKYVFENGQAFILILYTGLRMGEMLALEWQNVDFENKKIKIDGTITQVKNRDKKDDKEPTYKLIKQNTAKTQKSVREISLSKKAYNALLELKKTERYDPKGYVLTTKNNTFIRPRNFRNTYDAICKKANINKSGIHMLRHTFASLLFREKKSVKAVSKLLGHSTTRMANDIYIHLYKEEEDDAINALDNID